MKNTLPEVDEYIAEAAEFAQPILKRLRKLFHKASPKIEETIKWRMPHFECGGIVGMMAAFKNHVVFGLRKSELLNDSQGLFKDGKLTPFETRLTSLSELPNDAVLVDYIRQVIVLNEQGVKLPKRPAKKVARPKVPADLKAALDDHPKARETFQKLSPSCQRDYVEWLTEAKQQTTRDRRLATTIEWLNEGKTRNWKYEKKPAR
ncbi:MAG TPA: YdeI/OmpD-associated family protein [Schlesneria sp.]